MALKVPPPVVFLVTVLLMWGVSRVAGLGALPIPGGPIAAVVLVAAGLGLGVSAVMAFRRAATTVNPHALDRANRLVTSGVFRYSRNPMYLGLALLLLAWGLLLSNLLALSLLPAFVVYLNRYQIKPEEVALREKFGGHYLEYAHRTRRWL